MPKTAIVDSVDSPYKVEIDAENFQQYMQWKQANEMSAKDPNSRRNRPLDNVQDRPVNDQVNDQPVNNPLDTPMPDKTWQNDWPIQPVNPVVKPWDTRQYKRKTFRGKTFTTGKGFDKGKGKGFTKGDPKGQGFQKGDNRGQGFQKGDHKGQSF